MKSRYHDKALKWIVLLAGLFGFFVGMTCYLAEWSWVWAVIISFVLGAFTARVGNRIYDLGVKEGAA